MSKASSRSIRFRRNSGRFATLIFLLVLALVIGMIILSERQSQTRQETERKGLLIMFQQILLTALSFVALTGMNAAPYMAEHPLRRSRSAPKSVRLAGQSLHP
jgi:uncharacterized membrane protein YhiD involved in acid resistance